MDWVRFLDENNVSYVSRGPNTKRGEVSIRCPMCGDDDPSEHLGINLSSGKWGCHRDQSHRGKSARSLIKALLHVTSNIAEDIRRQYSRPDPNDLDSALAALQGSFEEPNVTQQSRKQKVDPEFNDFSKIKPRGLTKKFFTYLQGRGFDNPQELIDRYNLRCALTGRYQDRIILPVFLNNELLGWTSRMIGKSATAPRYLASSDDVKTTVLNYDELKKGGERLFIVEGPFDALKMDNFSLTYGKQILREYSLYESKPACSFRATCTFGTSPTISQLALLRNLAKAFDETYVLFDHGADGPANNLAEWVGAEVARMPMGVDDPGEFDEVTLVKAFDHHFGGYFVLHQLHWNILENLKGPDVHSRCGQRRRRYYA